MDPLFQAFLYGLGIGYGLLWIALAYVLKQAVLEPALEWVREAYEHRFVAPHPNETRASRFAGTGEIVVLSDLHVDTWDWAPEGRPAREKAFFEFLKIMQRTTMELLINGDLLDAPPNPEDTWQGGDVELKGSMFPKYERFLAEFAALNNQTPVPLPVTVLYGNHDMAASGLRYDLVKRSLLQRFQAPFNMSWYPNLILGIPIDPSKAGFEEYRFYVDHGHFYDPVLLLYLRDFLLGGFEIRSPQGDDYVGAFGSTPHR